MPVTVEAKDKQNRFDLTELPFVTIDGEDARDFDDAVYCEQHEESDGGFYVAIADVAHYVRPDSELDVSARERGVGVFPSVRGADVTGETLKRTLLLNQWLSAW